MPTPPQPEEWRAEETEDQDDYPPSALEPPRSKVIKEQVPWPEGSIFWSNHEPRPGLFPS